MNLWRPSSIGALVVFLSILTASAQNPEWVLKADYVDACSCDLACPCIFGEPSTHGYCKGATLVEIKEGNYGQVDLSGVTVLAVYNSGQWIKFLVSKNATKVQTDTVVEFLPIAEGFFDSPVRDVRNVPISVMRAGDTVKITTADTVVELKQVRGLNGEPIKVQGLPAHGFPGLPYVNHTQYKTVALIHESENENYNFSGTNGYTAEIDASSDSVRDLGKSGMKMSKVITMPKNAPDLTKYCALPAEARLLHLDANLRTPRAETSSAIGQ